MLVSAAHISFEHMIYLFTALDRGDELRLATRAGCGAQLVIERMTLKEPRYHGRNIGIQQMTLPASGMGPTPE